MAKKKNEETMVAMEAAENNDVEMEEAADEAETVLAIEEEPIADVPASVEDVAEPPPKKKRASKKKAEEPTDEVSEEPDVSRVEESRPKPKRLKEPKEAPILTIDVDGVFQTEDELAEIAWHEVQNAHRTRRILTGMLGGIENLDSGKTVAIVDYKGFRVLIPIKEMVFKFPNQAYGDEHTAEMIRHHKLISKMLGAEIDFIVKGIDSKTRSIVASRREAMLKKRETFYMELDKNGTYRVYDGRIVQARVIAVAEKAIRIEVFGVECSIMAKDLSWEWIGDANERFAVGDQILVRILSVSRESIEKLSIQADVKSVNKNRGGNLSCCRVQSKYAGKVTDVHKGVVYLRLTNGVNAVAHSCLDRRMPAKKDDVSFAVTHIDEERGVAVGIITRIIKQNL